MSFVYFQLGLQILPLDGNPFKSNALICHPAGTSTLTCSYDGRFVFTSGGFDCTVLSWELNLKWGATVQTIEDHRVTGFHELTLLWMQCAGGSSSSGRRRHAALLHHARGRQRRSLQSEWDHCPHTGAFPALKQSYIFNLTCVCTRFQLLHQLWGQMQDVNYK